MIRRIHNSDYENLAFKNVKTQKRYKGFIYGKPNGLWYGIDGDWLRWCKSEMPSWVHQYNYELKIDLSKMLVISNKAQLIQFHNRYTVSKTKYNHIQFIDWKAVTKDYAGIEINPYLYECRFLSNYFWYYGWDCASGCIWNKKAILSITKLKEVLNAKNNRKNS